MSSFHVFVDKENISQTSIHARPLSTGLYQTHAGKTFNTPSQPAALGGPRKTFKDPNAGDVVRPRKVLGMLDNFVQQSAGPRQNSKTLDGGIKQQIHKPTSLKSTNHEVEKNCSEVNETAGPVTAKAKTRNLTQAKDFDEIENMYIVDEEDDFEDLWPKCERPSTYLSHAPDWRPSRLLPYDGPDTSDEDADLLDCNDSIEFRDLGDPLDNIPQMNSLDGDFKHISSELTLLGLDDLSLLDDLDIGDSSVWNLP